jgi:hypothetical protein
MKLAQAYLCIDCDEIFSVAGQTNPACPNCASRTYAPIAGWLTTEARDPSDRALVRRYEFPDLAAADQQGKERSWRH